jgi:FkbM family methyltransferase
MPTTKKSFTLTHYISEFVIRLLCIAHPKFREQYTNKGKNLFEIDGFRFQIRPKTMDRRIIECVWDGEDYWRGNLKKDAVVVDIGAHIGSFSIKTSEMVPDGKIFAYEPFQESYTLLVKNIKLNNITNIHPKNVGVTDKNGSTRLYTNPFNTGANSLYNVIDSRRGPIVQTISLENVFESNGLYKIDLLKIDAEGSEYSILMNSSSELLGKIGRIVLEYHDCINQGHQIHELQKYLESNNFNVEISKSNFLHMPTGLGMLHAENSRKV